MAKNRLPAGRHLQSVVEWRYDRAHRYWDECGKLIAALEAEFPGLKCQDLHTTNGFRFAGESAGLTGASFYWDKATISQAGHGDARLPEAADRFWRVVADGLSVAVATWLGHRTWVCFETATPRDALHWLEGFTIWEFSSEDAGRLGSPRAIGSVLRTELEPNGRRLRLDVNPGTMTVADRAYHGVIADIDIVIEPPSTLPEDFREFVELNVLFIREKVEPLFRGKPKGK